MRFALFLIILISSVSYGQTYEECTNFDSSFSNTLIEMNGIWEVGSPNKSIFNTTLFGSKSIITDTLNHYPKNDTSSFIITYFSGGQLAEDNILWITMFHRFETDSILDFCSIEFSTDGGTGWHSMTSDSLSFNLINHHFIDLDTTVYNEIQFTGGSSGWVKSTLTKDIWNYNIIDSVLIKFTLSSDSIQNMKDGWQIDSICISETHYGSVSEYDLLLNFATVYPNPVKNNLTIDFTNKYNEAFSLRLVNSVGQVLKHQKDIRNEQIIIENLHLTPGLYYYELSVKGVLKGVGKIVVE